MNAKRPRKRTVWVWADSHNGHVVDGRDGADWADFAADELLRRVGRPDYVLMLGDITHAGAGDQFERYVRLRNRSGVPHWFEIIGNHDYSGVRRGDYARLIRRVRRYVVLDGNLCWVMVSAEQGGAKGLLRAPTRKWLGEVLAAHRDKIVILCTHQLVANTVRRTDPVRYWWRVLHPVEWVDDLLREHRIPLWLGGHEHGPPRTADQIARRRGTTFINVASLSHIYGTKACNSFWVEAVDGCRELLVRCRNHDRGRFLGAYTTRIPLPRAVRLGDGPRIAHAHGRLRVPR